MIIERLTIEDFKQFSKKLVIENLTPGLNVFTGNNEAGKSTIAEAVRTLFLERYSTTSNKEDILPWSKPNASPSIEASFTHNDTTYLLSKQFATTRKRCNLLKGTERLDGDEAEEHLAELFGFARSQRGALKPEHAGIPGLLWVQQGDSHRVAERAASAADYLRGALGQLSGGEVIGGEDVLIKAVEKQLGSLRTPSKREATGELAKVQRELSDLKAQRAAWQQQQDGLETDLATLEQLQALYDKDEQAKPWAELEKKAVAARAKLAEVSAAKQKLESLRQDLKLSTVTLSNFVEKVKAADALESSLRTSRESLAAAEAAAGEAESTYVTALAATTAAQAIYDRAVEAEGLANAAATAEELRGQLEVLQRDLLRLAASVEKAEKAFASFEEASTARAKLELDPKKLKKLKATTADLIPLRAQLEAASTRLEFRLNGPVELDDAPLSGIGSVVVETARTLRLPDGGELTIVPGVSDRQMLVEQIAKLETDETRLLQTMGVASLSDAETQLEHWKAFEAQVKAHQEVLALHAPEGVDALKTSLAEVRSRELAALARLEALPDTKDALPLVKAVADTKKAAQQLEAARTAQTEATEKRSIARANKENLTTTVKAKEAEIADPTFMQAQQDTSTAMFEEANRNKVLKDSLERAEAEHAALTLIDPQAEVSRFTESARLAQDKHFERERKIIDLRARIQTAGGSGVGENLARSASELELLETREQELTRRADALCLLVDLLVQERNAAIQQLQSPLTKRLEHYLKWLFPHSAMTLAENLAPFTLGRAERFDTLTSLSYGTQEQLGILTRLAYADLLKEAGRPTVLFFDDAAVHTDALRRDAIKQALLDASTRHQIFLFTCHPENWNDLGVEQRALEELKAAA